MAIFISAEIGINHNGDMSICKKLIDVAKEAGCDAVKFQKRDIDLVYTKGFLDSNRESPWGKTQRDQKLGLEFKLSDYKEIDNSEIHFALYKNSNNGNIYMGIGGPSVKKVVDPLPPGDGSSNRDNGIRGDIAFKALITLSNAHKLELINKFLPGKPMHGDASEAYEYVHPDGL